MKGKHFLKLLDFTPAQITELLDSAADFKAKKRLVFPIRSTRARTLSCCLKRILPVPAAPLRLRARIWVCPLPI